MHHRTKPVPAPTGATSLPELITIEEAAARLCTPIGTIRNWIGARRITSYKPGRRVLLDARELAALLQASARPALNGGA